jgi:hypothetical protein
LETNEVDNGGNLEGDNLERSGKIRKDLES